MIVVLFLIVFVLLVLLVWSIVINLWMGVPYVTTPTQVTDVMIRLADIQPGQRVYDLGAGDGRLLSATKKQHPAVEAIGYECTPTVFLWGKFRSWLAGSNIQYRFGDLFRQDLSQANVIFVYLSPQWMKSLLQKFEAELQPGTRIVSHAFSLPGREPAETKTVTVGQRERTVRMYIW